MGGWNSFFPFLKVKVKTINVYSKSKIKTKAINKQNLEHFKMINRRLFSHKFFNNLKKLLSSSWAIFIRTLVFSFSPRVNLSSLKYLCFSFLSNFLIHSYWVQKSLNRKIITLSSRLRSSDYALIKQVSISFDTTNHCHILFLFN